MPTAVEGVGLKAIIAVMMRKAGGDANLVPTPGTGVFGLGVQDVLLNFADIPRVEKNFGQEIKAGLLLPAVQEELGLLGVSTLDDVF